MSLKVLKTLLLQEAFVLPKKKTKEMSTLILQYGLNNSTKSAIKLANEYKLEFKYSDDVGCYIELKNSEFILKLNYTLIVDSALYFKSLKEYISLYDLFSNKSKLAELMKKASLEETKSLYKLIALENNNDFIDLIRKYN